MPDARADVNAEINSLLHHGPVPCDLADMDNIQLSRRMRAWREYRNLLQHQVGDVVGWTSSAISQIERGKSDITVDKLARICKRAFKTDLVTFLGPLPKVSRSA